MTTLTFIAGIVLVTYSIISAFCPVAYKTDLVLEHHNFISIPEKEKPIEINDIISIEPCEAKVSNYFIDVVSPMFTYYDVPLSDEIQQYIHLQCLEKFGMIELCGYNLPKLVINIIRWESGFDADNDNGKCCGLMSVTHKLSDTIREEESITNLIEPKQNIRAGVRILKNMYDYAYTLLSEHTVLRGAQRYNLPIRLMLNYYHNGRDKWEMDKYVDNILSTYDTTKERS